MVNAVVNWVKLVNRTIASYYAAIPARRSLAGTSGTNPESERADAARRPVGLTASEHQRSQPASRRSSGPESSDSDCPTGLPSTVGATLPEEKTAAVGGTQYGRSQRGAVVLVTAERTQLRFTTYGLGATHAGADTVTRRKTGSPELAATVAGVARARCATECDAIGRYP
jgi:hypothetical protein